MKLPYNKTFVLSLIGLKETIPKIKEQKQKYEVLENLQIYWLKYGFLIIHKEEDPSADPLLLCKLVHVNHIGFTVCKTGGRWCIYADNLGNKKFSQESIKKSWFEIVFAVLLRGETEDGDVPSLKGADEVLKKLLAYGKGESNV